MSAIRAVFKKFSDEGYRVFATALLASFLWHAFWLFTIKIAPNRYDSSEVKFSKVSFLGPLLDKGSMELRAAPKEMTFLEKRYVNMARSFNVTPESSTNRVIDRYDASSGQDYMRDNRVTREINDALGAEKLEPPDYE